MLPHVSQVIAAGHSHSSPQTLTLDARKLRPGKHYTVRYEFHGHIAEATFTALQGHAPTPKRRAAKKATSRKATLKKAATRRPAVTKGAAKMLAVKRAAAKKAGAK